MDTLQRYSCVTLRTLRKGSLIDVGNLPVELYEKDCWCVSESLLAQSRQKASGCRCALRRRSYVTAVPQQAFVAAICLHHLLLHGLILSMPSGLPSISLSCFQRGRELTKGIDSNSGCKVQVLVAMSIIHARTFCMGEDDLWPYVGLNYIPAGPYT